MTATTRYSNDLYSTVIILFSSYTILKTPTHNTVPTPYFLFLYQVRPIFDNLNKNSHQWFGQSGRYSVDETMVPYFGRHSSKQYIRGKPIRYGYKV